MIIDNTHPLVMMHDKLMLAFEPKKKNEEEKKVHKMLQVSFRINSLVVLCMQKYKHDAYLHAMPGLYKICEKTAVGRHIPPNE